MKVGLQYTVGLGSGQATLAAASSMVGGEDDEFGVY
jgi:hypothetical protein